jgi:hypothetical protein
MATGNGGSGNAVSGNLTSTSQYGTYNFTLNGTETGSAGQVSIPSATMSGSGTGTIGVGTYPYNTAGTYGTTGMYGTTGSYPYGTTGAYPYGTNGMTGITCPNLTGQLSVSSGSGAKQVSGTLNGTSTSTVGMVGGACTVTFNGSKPN